LCPHDPPPICSARPSRQNSQARRPTRVRWLAARTPATSVRGFTPFTAEDTDTAEPNVLTHVLAEWEAF